MIAWRRLPEDERLRADLTLLAPSPFLEETVIQAARRPEGEHWIASPEAGGTEALELEGTPLRLPR